MRVRTLLATGTAIYAAIGSVDAAVAEPASKPGDRAPPAPAQIEAMQAQLRSLEAQVAYMKRQLELVQQQAPAKPEPTAAKVTLANGRPQFASSDGNFKFNIQARAQTDYANYFGLPHGLQLNNGFNQRRAYIGLDGFFYQDWEGFLEADFGSGTGNENKTTGYLRTARLTYSGKNAGLGNLAFDIGYMEINSDFERAMGSTNTFLMERSSPEQIAANVAAADRRAAVGVRDYGERWFGDLYYTGARTGQGNTDGVTTANIKNEQSAMTGRVSFLPWIDDDSLIHVGVNGQYVFSPNESAPNLSPPRRTIGLSFQPGLNVDSTAFINTTGNNAGGTLPVNSGAVIGGELGAEWRNVAVFGQWYHYLLDVGPLPASFGSNPTATFDGFDVNFSYVLTGESRGYDRSVGSFGAVKPTHPFNPSTGDWGAWELVARFEQTNLNDRAGALLVEGGRQTLYELGVSWYPNSNLRFILEYLYADIRRAAIVGSGPTARLAAPAPGSNLQPSINALGFRTQFAF